MKGWCGSQILEHIVVWLWEVDDRKLCCYTSCHLHLINTQNRQWQKQRKRDFVGHLFISSKKIIKNKKSRRSKILNLHLLFSIKLWNKNMRRVPIWSRELLEVLSFMQPVSPLETAYLYVVFKGAIGTWMNECSKNLAYTSVMSYFF